MSRHEFVLKGGAILLLSIVVYYPAIHGELLWDDTAAIGEDAVARAPGGLKNIWLGRGLPDYFPLTMTSFWLEWRLWGEDPAGYHVTNVLLHSLGAILLWLALRKLSIPGAWLAALLFTVHPVCVESVAWISERKNVLSLVFFAASVLTYLSAEWNDDDGRPTTDDRPEARHSALRILHSAFPGLSGAEGCTPYVLSLVFFLLALLAKTSVVMLPVVLLGCAWWMRGRIEKRDLVRTAPFFALALVLGLVTVWFQYHRAFGDRVFTPNGLYDRLMAAGWAVWFYWGKALLPGNLAPIYPGWDLKGTASLSPVPLVLLIACATVLIHYRRTWGRPALFGLGYFVVMLLPALGLFKMFLMNYSLVADRLQYAALIGVTALVAGLGKWGFDRSRPAIAGLAPGLGVLLVCILGVLTWRQAHVYGDQETFWREAATRAPNSWVTHFNLAGAFMQKGRPVEAIPEYRATLQLNPGYARAHHRFGAALLADGKPDEARTQFREALSLDPGFAEAHGGLGDVFLTTEKWEDACREYAVALAGRPDLIKVRAAYAVALTQAGRAQEAVAQYELLLRQLPGDVRSHNNLGRLLAAEGRLAEAVAHYQAALVLAPDSAVVQCNLAWLLACADDARYRRPQEALGLAERACALTQWRDARSLDALAAAEAALGSWPDAVTHAQQAQEFATAAGQSARASRIAKRLELYRGRAAVHLGSKIPLE